jgi:chaperonin GroES
MNETQIKTIADNVMVYQHEKEEVTKGGLILPETDSAKAQPIADVISAGPDCKEVKTGDVVIFGTYAGTEIIVDEMKYLILKEDDILAVVSC